MKKTLTALILILTALFLFSCDQTAVNVRDWFMGSSQSEISYDLGGVTGNAVFTYHSENNNKIHFVSGEALEGVEFSFVDGTVTARLIEDSLEWQAEPEITQTLSLFGKLYAYCASLEEASKKTKDDENNLVCETFDYLDGSLEITYSKTDAKPVKLVYTQAGQTVKLEINDIKPLNEKE